MGEFQLTRVELIVYAAISILVALWCYYRWTIRRFLRLSTKINMCTTYPIIGSSLVLVGPRNFVKNTTMYEEKFCPGPIGVWLGPLFAVILSKPEDIQIIFNSRKTLSKGMVQKFLREVLGEGLISAPVEKWKKDRRLIAPAFNSNVIQQFLTIFYESNKIFIKNLGGKVGKTEPFDLWDYIYAHSLDVICQTTMGYSTRIQSNETLEFENALNISAKSVFVRACKPWLHPDVMYYIYKKLTGFEKIYKSGLKLPLRIIQEKKKTFEREKIANGGVENIKGKNLKTLLDTLLNFEKTGANFSDNDLLHHVLTMISVGSDTSCSTLCISLLLLAIHQNIQDKVYSELYSVLGDDQNTISIDEVNKLVYLDQVLKETMRLYPTVPFIIRNLQDDVKISSGDLVLPKGTMAIISANGTHHLPELYPNPWTFNPDNFTQENIDKRHKYSFIPFGGGPRLCIGDKYAMLFMKIFLAMFLQNFSVHTDIELKDIEFEYHMIVKNSVGYPVTIQSRNRTSMYH